MRNQRQGNRNIAAQDVTHGKKNNGSVLLLAQRWIMRNNGIRSGQVFAVADKRAFGMTGGAGGVDDKSGVAGR